MWAAADALCSFISYKHRDGRKEAAAPHPPRGGPREAGWGKADSAPSGAPGAAPSAPARMGPAARPALTVVCPERSGEAS